MLDQLNAFFRIVEQMSAVDTSGVEPLYTPLAALHAAPSAPARRRRHRRRRARSQPAQRPGGRGRPVPRAEGDRMSAAPATGELHSLGVAALARALRDRQVSSVEATAHLLARLAAHERLGVALASDAEQALAAARAADQRRRAGEAGPLLGVPIGHKDIFVTRDLADDGRLAHARRLSQPLRCDRRRPPRRGRRGDARQAQLRRVRDGLEQRELGLGAGAQPVGRDAGSRRLVGWLGGRRRGPPAAGGHRHRHRWLDPPAGQLLRHHRHQADLRRLLALRHGRVRLEPRPGRPAGPQRRGLRAAALGHERLRRARLDQRRAAAAGLRAAAWRRRARSDAPASRCAALRIGLPREFFPAALAADVESRAARRARRARAPRRHAWSTSACRAPSCRSRSTT